MAFKENDRGKRQNSLGGDSLWYGTEELTRASGGEKTEVKKKK